MNVVAGLPITPGMPETRALGARAPSRLLGARLKAPSCWIR